MKLEKNKVYKIKHVIKTNWGWDRDYILCSPANDVQINDGELGIRFFHFDFFTVFVVGFDGGINVKTDKNTPATTFFWDCVLEEITPSDYKDIRKVIDKYNISHNDKMLYNRKKNCLVFK